MGLTALLLLQHARAPARFDATGSIVLLEDQDRSLWTRPMIGGGARAHAIKALLHSSPGPYQVQAAIAALHARPRGPKTPTGPELICLYATLERVRPSPVITLNRAVAVSKLQGAEARLP